MKGVKEMVKEDFEKIEGFLSEFGLSFKLLSVKKNYNYYTFSFSVETKNLSEWFNF
jgi:hypothetical protein